MDVVPAGERAALPKLAGTNLQRTIHLAFCYDEEADRLVDIEDKIGKTNTSRAEVNFVMNRFRRRLARDRDRAKSTFASTIEQQVGTGMPAGYVQKIDLHNVADSI